jgi:hypothetical protein
LKISAEFSHEVFFFYYFQAAKLVESFIFLETFISEPSACDLQIRVCTVTEEKPVL